MDARWDIVAKIQLPITRHLFDRYTHYRGKNSTNIPDADLTLVRYRLSLAFLGVTSTWVRYLFVFLLFSGVTSMASFNEQRRARHEASDDVVLLTEVRETSSKDEVVREEMHVTSDDAEVRPERGAVSSEAESSLARPGVLTRRGIAGNGGG